MRSSRAKVRDPRADQQLQQRRALVGFALVFLALAVLAGRFAYLQIASYGVFHTRSEQNRIKARPIVPARGLIYDRNGRLLADNVPAWRLEAVREEVGDMEAMLQRLREVLPLSDEEAEAFLAASRARPKFQSTPVKLRLSEAEVARFAVNRHRFPGVEVVPYLNRRYPYGELFAHVIGYVGRLDQADLATRDASRYAGTTHIGKAGIERYYEDRLHGQVGVEEVEINAEGRTLRTVARTPAHAGQDLFLSIDAELQQAAVGAFQGQHGAAVVLDPRNGEVLALVSLPAYDPNPFVSGIGRNAYRELLDSPGRPLFNRVLQGGYEPGSTIKPFVGLAGLELGLRRPQDTTLSTGAFRLPGQEREYRDVRRGGHGLVNLDKAIAQSVNTYFFQLAVDMGIDRFSGYMAQLGFGKPTGIDLPGEASGVLPSREWKQANRHQVWFPGETVISGIGQGYWVATPLQLAQATAMLADGGVRRPPHLLRASQSGFDVARQQENRREADASIVRDPANIAAVTHAMMQVLEPGGSAYRVAQQFQFDYPIAGKTGTAQRITRKGEASLDVNNLPYNLRHNALFVAFAPADAPRIAVMVVVEHGGFGSSAAAPVGFRIVDAWMKRNPP